MLSFLAHSDFVTLFKDNQEGYQNILEKWWNETDEHDQKEYKKLALGTKTHTTEATEESKDDLLKYEPQKIEDKSPHSFCLLICFPTKVDIVVYPPPQVIADARNPQFESLLKAPKKAKRYIHTYDQINSAWAVK